ncbi:MAG: hypothetical protein K5838_00730 [Elusimicrobiales bacterium]|nr:hypothetical protein [Elusimicrobiales bacterium]
MSGNQIFSFSLENVFREAAGKIDKIASRLDAEMQYVPTKHDIEALKRKFLTYCSSVSSYLHYFSRKEIRQMCYCINSLIDFEKEGQSVSEKRVEIFINLLRNNWSKRYLRPLCRFMLSDWDKMLRHKNFHSFILNEIKKSNSGIKFISKINTYMHFFSYAGAKYLGSYLKQNKKTLADCVEMLGLRKKNITYSYFRNVMIYYYSEAEAMDDSFEEYMELCDSNETRKVILPQLIADIDEKERSAPALWQKQKEILKSLAIKYIGMPKDILWNVAADAPDKAKENIKKAMNIVRRWITQQYIDVVFNKLMRDEKRACFWKKYAGSIDNFKVVGGDNTRSVINNEFKGIDIQEHYIPVLRRRKYSVYNYEIVAFIMWIRDRKIIEFSDTGNALFVYVESEWKTLSWSSVPELKMKNCRGLIGRNGYNDSGRLIHSFGWQDKLQYWLQNKLNIFPD